MTVAVALELVDLIIKGIDAARAANADKLSDEAMHAIAEKQATASEGYEQRLADAKARLAGLK